ncbi:hypothetical protein Csa_012889 [Cucumis sativus]|nr:hypothetical protein Csa_012889 [Cucumis sativus]
MTPICKPLLSLDLSSKITLNKDRIYQTSGERDTNGATTDQTKLAKSVSDKSSISYPLMTMIPPPPLSHFS